RRGWEGVLSSRRGDAAAVERGARVGAEPLDEGWWALLMRVHYRRGHQAEALRTLQRARRVLADELGLSPGPELQQPERAVLDGGGDQPAPEPTVIRISRLPAR